MKIPVCVAGPACRFPAKERARVELFLAPFILVPFDQEAARTATNVRQKLEKQGRRIGPYDLLIAGQAITLDVILVTHNLRVFGRVPGLRLETWET
ncbi:MAG: type II toxin-antitoxin system VapC family toxin [Verrucomicrobia bacterium]|nr:type II toxin-antitoxin system VapC family toxin [Verrucomicrobiota bacterium]